MSLSKFFTIQEGVLSFVVALILIVTAFVMTNPTTKVGEWQDKVRSEQLIQIDKALQTYLEQHDGSWPRYDNGKSLPKVNKDNILEKGVDLKSLDNFVPDYLSNAPNDPNGLAYKVGVGDNNQVMVASRTTTGQTITNLDLKDE